MGQRFELQSLFENILGSKNVYFQPPETTKIKYPCIVYNLLSYNTEYADNFPYNHSKRYKVTVIDPNPDSIIPDSIASLSMCIFDRHYVVDNLHHTVFNLYF